MTTTEAAALLNTALRNVQNYCKRHNLPKRGRDYDIAAADIEGIRAELGRVGRPKSEHSTSTIILKRDSPDAATASPVGE